MSKEARVKISAGNTGKKRSPEVIARARLRTGELTTAYGTVWMKLGDQRRRIKRDQATIYKEQGWSYGKL